MVPQVQMGDNSYRNVVSCCMECNTQKGKRRAEDFLRGLYREGRLSAAELSGRLRALAELGSGKLRPRLPGRDEGLGGDGVYRAAAKGRKVPGRFAEGPRHPGLSCPPPQ
ncbi:MAG TPA: hypothetical protein VFN26_11410 [Candidatus Acidoferrum sp.]|nr:hypothetical protein [Candidatus Acidoferrum sp.]